MNEATKPETGIEDGNATRETANVVRETANAVPKPELGASRIRTGIRCGTIGNVYYAIV